MQSNIGHKLKDLRLSMNLTGEDVVTRLKEKNIVISAKTLYGYENNVSPVRSSTFLALCEIYGVSNVFDTFLSSLPEATFHWEKDNYEDYFNGRSVNEKFDILVENGIPSFEGFEGERSSDVFFGSSSNSDLALLRAYRNAGEDIQNAIRLLLKLK